MASFFGEVRAKGGFGTTVLGAVGILLPCYRLMVGAESLYRVSVVIVVAAVESEKNVYALLNRSFVGPT